MAYPLHRPDSPGVAAVPAFAEVERQILDYWQQDGTFEESVAQRPADAQGQTGGNEYVFYDGPPFANGLPHYGHLLTGYVKDVVPRYQTMRGHRVERRFGWDCHGLPAEIEAERELGIEDKSEIDAMGVAQFNAACHASVLKYTDVWQDYVTRQARWVDFDNDYKTLDLSYMESVMWAFKTLWEKGLIYEGHRVLWYCYRCGTPLSASETKMDEVYRDRQDTAVTVAFEMLPPRAAAPAKLQELAGCNALAWTTTPWTLPSNLAMAVHPEVEYVLAIPETMPDERVLIAAARLGAYKRELGAEPTVLETYKGAELAGLQYKPLFDFFEPQRAQAAFQILLADYVTTEDGTGLVHIAPAFGEEDKVVTDAAGIALINPVDGDGRFTEQVPPWQGLRVFEANKPITQALKASGQLLRQESVEHAYPHCWRCDTPLIQYAVSSWFVKVTAFRDRMVEVNQQINWLPSHVRDGQFGKWLAGARDWSISRNRYWGSPIPVWVSDDPAYPRVDIYGSLDELERDFGTRPADLHRPYVDELTRPNPDDPTGQATMRRVPEVLDCWFESGSMPFAQVHYPFENRDWFDTHNPGDFIVEYIGQTRGWFYTMHVLATALFDRPAFSTCLTHGIVLGDDGLKMSKSKGNFPDVRDVFNRDGSDALRWYLMSGPILRGGNLSVAEEPIRAAVRQVILPLWNTWSFYALYANAAGGGAGLSGRRLEAADYPALTELDRYILSRTHLLVEQATTQMDAYAIGEACDSLREYADLLTNWYVRGSRDRFWAEDATAFNVLYTVLETVLRLAAPLMPMVGEEIWRGLTGGRSVHLEPWPDLAPASAPMATEAGNDSAPAGRVFSGSRLAAAACDKETALDQALPMDAELMEAMDRVREVCSATLALRKAAQIRVRQPLRLLVVADSAVDRLAPFLPLIQAEVNVKQIELLENSSEVAAAHGVATRLEVNARAAGPRLGKAVQAVIQAVKAGSWVSDDAGRLVVETSAGPVELLEGEYTRRTVVDQDSSGRQRTAGVLAGGGFVLLDLELDDELKAEGYARDLVRLVQDQRKAQGLHVSDRIELELAVPAERVPQVEAHAAMIQAETLSVTLKVALGSGDAVQATITKVPQP